MATYRHTADPLDAYDLQDPFGVRWQLRDGVEADQLPGEPPITDEIRELAWRRLRDELVDELSAMDPGSRPEAWWWFDHPGPDPVDSDARLRALLAAGELDAKELAAIVDQAGLRVGPAEDGAVYSEAFVRRAQERADVVRDHLTTSAPMGAQTDGKDAP